MSREKMCAHGNDADKCWTCELDSKGSFAAPAGCAAQIPDVLFDGNAVWQSLDERAKTRTSAENVSDVLDAIVRLMRRDARPNAKVSHGGDE